MARYSSDSESDHSLRHRRKHRKSRSSSSDSSNSSSHRRRTKHSRSKRRHRTRSRSRGRERSSKSYKCGRNNSRERRRHRSHKSKSPSADYSRKKYRSLSRDKSRSRSNSSQPNTKPSSDRISNIVKDEFAIEPRFRDSVLNEINSEGFTPKQFTSSSQTKESKLKNIVIDITADTIHVPAIVSSPNNSDSIFHTSIMHDQEVKFDKWVKRLYSLRQKAILDMTFINTI